LADIGKITTKPTIREGQLGLRFKMEDYLHFLIKRFANAPPGSHPDQGESPEEYLHPYRRRNRDWCCKLSFTFMK
jgi:hypothetical protein